MKSLMTLLVALLLLSGCATTRETGMVPPRQVLVKVSSFPAFDANVSSKDMDMRVAFLVLANGSIADVQVLKSDGDQAWNSMATVMMKQWHFNPITVDTAPEGRWIQYSLVVHIEDPVVMTLAELTADEQQEADSLYESLKREEAFVSMEKQIATSPSGDGAKFLGAVDIAAYPQHVRDELRTLRVNHFTHPLRLGNSYVIYVRFDEDRFKNLAQ